MILLNINKSWTYKDFSLYKKALRCRYKRALMSFSCYELKEKIKYMRNVKKLIYSFKFAEWKRDSIWMYLNN